MNRGWYFRPRDIFDFAAACSTANCEKIENALLEYPDEVAATITAIKSINLDFLECQFNDLVISEKYMELRSDALEFTLSTLTKIAKEI